MVDYRTALAAVSRGVHLRARRQLRVVHRIADMTAVIESAGNADRADRIQPVRILDDLTFLG